MANVQSEARFHHTHAPVRDSEIVLGRALDHDQAKVRATMGYAALRVEATRIEDAILEVVGLSTEESVLIRGLGARQHTICAVGKIGLVGLAMNPHGELTVQRNFDPAPITVPILDAQRQNPHLDQLFWVGSSIRRDFISDSNRWFRETLDVNPELEQSILEQGVQQMFEHLTRHAAEPAGVA